MAGLALARAHDWKEFRAAMAHYKVPSENLVYADTKGNIGWQVGGLTPIRDGWSGLLPVPGDEGRYEWKGFRDSGELPFEFNPPRHYIATANNNILPPGYTIPLGYDSWAQPYRVNRIREMLASGGKFDIEDFVRMQQDFTSSLARRFVAVLRNWRPQPGTRAAQVVDELRRWDGVLAADSRAALVYEVWMTHLPAAMGRASGGADAEGVLRALEAQSNAEALQKSLDTALEQIAQRLGRAEKAWQWGKLHQLLLAHPLGKSE
jgi:penicillin amidase